MSDQNRIDSMGEALANAEGTFWNLAALANGAQKLLQSVEGYGKTNESIEVSNILHVMDLMAREAAVATDC